MKFLLTIYKPILYVGAWLTFAPLAGFWIALFNAAVFYGILLSAILYWVK